MFLAIHEENNIDPGVILISNHNKASILVMTFQGRSNLLALSEEIASQQPINVFTENISITYLPNRRTGIHTVMFHECVSTEPLKCLTHPA